MLNGLYHTLLHCEIPSIPCPSSGKFLIIRQNSGGKSTSSVQPSLTTASGLPRKKLGTPSFPLPLLPGMTLVTLHHNGMFA